MKKYKELKEVEIQAISGGVAVTPPKGAFPNGDFKPWNVPSGTTFPWQGACPVGSVTAGYIGGGQNLCRETIINIKTIIINSNYNGNRDRLFYLCSHCNYGEVCYENI
jgi:hypothetical protein